MKKTKVAVHYRPRSFYKPFVNCGTCKFMLKDGHCRLVIGLVDRKHVCNLWRYFA